jgi:ribosome-binding ATPase
VGTLSPPPAQPRLDVATGHDGAAAPPAEVAAHASRPGAAAIAISARVEAELAELDADEAAEMRAELGIAAAGLERLVGAAAGLLGLITFFTAHQGSEATARHLSRGATAWEAAGRVHSDFQRDFVRAEVIGWDKLVEAGGYGPARDRGLLRTEGRDYVVADGDVVTIRT